MRVFSSTPLVTIIIKRLFLQFGIIYACTQKNLGTAGLTIMVVREDLMGNQRKDCPAIFDFKVVSTHQKNEYNRQRVTQTESNKMWSDGTLPYSPNHLSDLAI